MRLLATAALALSVTAAAFAGPGEPASGEVVSGDGQWIARIDNDAPALVIADAATGTTAHLRRLETRTHVETRATALIAMPARRSFVVALAGVPEIWEIALDPDAGPFHTGFVHSYETGMEESLAAEEGLFARLRIVLDAPLVALDPAPGRRYSVIGTRSDGTRVEISLAAKREVGVLPPG